MRSYYTCLHEVVTLETSAFNMADIQLQEMKWTEKKKGFISAYIWPAWWQNYGANTQNGHYAEEKPKLTWTKADLDQVAGERGIRR